MKLPSFISNLFKSRKQREAEASLAWFEAMGKLRAERLRLKGEIAKAVRLKRKRSHLEARLNSVLNQMLSLELKKAGRDGR